MTITLPLPPQRIKPNVRSHWRQRAKATAAYRMDARLAAMSEAHRCGHIECLAAATVRIKAYWPTKTKMDPDNLIAAMKAAFDGITDAGIWLDDRELTLLPCLQDKDASDPRIEIEVW